MCKECVHSKRISCISPALYPAAPGKSSFSSNFCCSSQSTSTAACGCDLVQMINPSLCLVVARDHLWFSFFSGAQDGALQHWSFSGAIGVTLWRQTLKMVPSCSSCQNFRGKLWLVFFPPCSKHDHLSRMYEVKKWSQVILWPLRTSAMSSTNPHAWIFFRCLHRDLPVYTCIF